MQISDLAHLSPGPWQVFREIGGDGRRTDLSLHGRFITGSHGWHPYSNLRSNSGHSQLYPQKVLWEKWVKSGIDTGPLDHYVIYPRPTSPVIARATSSGIFPLFLAVQDILQRAR